MGHTKTHRTLVPQQSVKRIGELHMQFFSNKIVNPAGNEGPTWDDWVRDNFTTKEASEAKPECDDDPRGQCRGQVINNDNEPEAHSYQEGESVDGKPDQDEGGSKESKVQAQTKEADCGKEMGECDNAGKVTEDHTDAGSADEGDAACEQNINNDPNYQKGESTDPGKVDGKNKKESSIKGIKKSASGKKFQKVASLDRKEKLELLAAMTGKKNKSGTAAWPIQYCEAMVGLKFSNLKDDEKSWFKQFWTTMYPDSYVEEMVADR